MRSGRSRGEAGILQREPSGGDVHIAEDAIPFHRSMPIGATTRDESKFADDLGETCHVSWRMTRMEYFHTIKAQCGEPLDTGTCAIAARMCPDGQRASTVADSNRVLNREPRFWNIPWAAKREIPVERLTEIGDMPTIDKHPGDVRTTNGATICDTQHVVKRDWDMASIESLDHLSCALDTLLTECREAGTNGHKIGDMEHEQMNFLVTVMRAQLTARNDTNAELSAGLECVREPIDGVVIGQCDGA